jgi:hypothetical protein
MAEQISIRILPFSFLWSPLNSPSGSPLSLFPGPFARCFSSCWGWWISENIREYLIYPIRARVFHSIIAGARSTASASWGLRGSRCRPNIKYNLYKRGRILTNRGYSQRGMPSISENIREYPRISEISTHVYPKPKTTYRAKGPVSPPLLIVSDSPQGLLGIPLCIL